MSEGLKKGMLNGLVTVGCVVVGLLIYDKFVAPKVKAAPKA
jgi:hypothetical protein